MRNFVVFAILAVVALAGCLEGDGASNDGIPDAGQELVSYVGSGTHEYVLAEVQERIFESRIIDGTRAGGEPVIAMADDGSLIVMAHPGWTHYHPTFSDPDHTELVAPANGQSYLWRSTDNGTTWNHVGLVGNTGPRSAGTGFSDPDITVDDTGRIWYTDLQALAEQSVSYSDDHGATWTAGNVVAGAGPYVDRQWIGSHGDRVYLTANYFVDRSAGQSSDGARPFMTTNDDGLTWETIGYAPCGGDFLADPTDGALIMACGLGVAVSNDEGATWDIHESPAGIHRGFFAHEPAIDTAGGIFLAANGQPLTPHDPNHIYVSYTSDRGANWTVLDLSPAVADFMGANGTHVFAWVSAGSQGRAAVSWIGTPDHTGAASQAVDAKWYVYSAFITDMHAAPSVEIVQVLPDPVHVGPMCSSGTTCQVQSVGVDPIMGTDNGDRRMGDFFETTVDANGNLLYAVADTHASPDDVISHPRFIRLVNGPGLLDETETWPQGWPTQG